MNEEYYIAKHQTASRKIIKKAWSKSCFFKLILEKYGMMTHGVHLCQFKKNAFKKGMAYPICYLFLFEESKY